MVGLYEEPEKPGNAIEFIKKMLGAPSDTDVEGLKAQNEELKREKAVLEDQIRQLTEDLNAAQARNQ